MSIIQKISNLFILKSFFLWSSQFSKINSITWSYTPKKRWIIFYNIFHKICSYKNCIIIFFTVLKYFIQCNNVCLFEYWLSKQIHSLNKINLIFEKYKWWWNIVFKRNHKLYPILTHQHVVGKILKHKIGRLHSVLYSYCLTIRPSGHCYKIRLENILYHQ